MNEAIKPPVWRMVRDAVEALGGKTTNVAVRDWILKRYPGTNTTTIACQIIVCTVNHASRIHYSDNQKPRKASGSHDFLFRPSSGEVEFYDPAHHGVWEIAELDDGKLAVRREGEIEEIQPPVPENGFAAEAHLRDFLVKNLHLIEEGLRLYADVGGSDGVEYQTAIGRIDILAVDKNDNLLIVELKVARGPDQVCGQIMRYVGWVKRHLAKKRKVRGLIIAQHISDKLRYALADVPDVSTREYKLHITLQEVAQLGYPKG
jgi:hypothetical protein